MKNKIALISVLTVMMISCNSISDNGKPGDTTDRSLDTSGRQTIPTPPGSNGQNTSSADSTNYSYDSSVKSSDSTRNKTR